MAYRKLPSVTRNRITEYFEHRYQVYINVDIKGMKNTSLILQ